MKKRNLNRRILFADEIIESNKHTEEQDEKLKGTVEAVEVDEYLGKSYSLPQDIVNENEESGSFGRETSSVFSDSSRIFERLESISRSPEEPNLLGVFGMDSDLVINEVKSDLRNCRNCFYLGEINTNLLVDIGDAILATVFRYIEDNLLYYISDYSIRELYSQIEHNVNPTFDDEFDTPLERIEKLSLKSKRFSNIKNIFEKLNTIMSHEYERRERKFVIVIEMNENSFSYSNLKKISSLKCKNLIIIIKTMLSMEFANMLICKSSNLNPRETSIIYKFFTTSNIFCVY